MDYVNNNLQDKMAQIKTQKNDLAKESNVDAAKTSVANSKKLSTPTQTVNDVMTGKMPVDSLKDMGKANGIKVDVIKNRDDLKQVTQALANDKSATPETKQALQNFSKMPSIDNLKAVIDSYAKAKTSDAETKELAAKVNKHIDKMNDAVKVGDIKAAQEAYAKIEAFGTDFGKEDPINPNGRGNNNSGEDKANPIRAIISAGPALIKPTAKNIANAISDYVDYVKDTINETNSELDKMRQSQQAQGGCPPGHNWGPHGCIGNYGQNGNCP